MLRKLFRIVLLTGVLVGLIAGAGGLGVGFYYYFRLTRDLPQIESLKDYRPKAVTSIYSADGTLIAEAFDENGRRYPVEFKDIPPLIIHAFLAAEDANFYSHPGIDPVSILRAVIKNLMKKKVKQGASTITQQTVKSLLLSREKSFERKAKEAILSYRLEKYLTKDEILSIYLNEIYLGSGASGIRAAAKVHFHKELNQLTIGEAAFLAGLPQRPSELTNPKNRKDAIERQHYVIGQMLSNKMISKEEADTALKEPLNIYKPDERTIFAAPYFSGYVINEALPGIFKKISPYLSATNPGGYEVRTSVDVNATNLGVQSLQRGLREVDKREGWRGPIKHIESGDTRAQPGTEHLLNPEDLSPYDVYRAVIEKVGPEAGVVTVQVGALEGTVDLKKAGWAKRFLKDDHASTVEPAKLLRPGDVIEVSLEESEAETDKGKDKEKEKEKEAKENKALRFKLDQTPLLEGAFMLANPLTGEVKVMIGGYDYQRSQFNRVTAARRQPGSSFKPIIYLTALETLGFTPSTIVPDEPISLPAGNGQLWTPGNFDGKFLGPITLRTALQRSRNVVSVYLLTHEGMHRAIDTAHRLGLTTDIPENLSISLGSAEVEMFELVRAYGAFASGGLLADPLVVTSIKDRDGNLVYEQEPHAHRVIDEDYAFLMANMMKGVVERGTATILRQLERPMAGKTGTTNDQMDAWFIGYTPEWVAGTWVGFDQKKSIGRLETGGKAAAPVMLYFMKKFLANTPPIDFTIADGVVPVAIHLESGQPVSPDSPGAFIEYFKSGTEPKPVEAAPPDEETDGEVESDESDGEAAAPTAPDPAPGPGGKDYLRSQEF
ncbi:MAG: PBP1A family penicillin-binding protein [Bdellovibrionota bacterium]